MSCFCLFGKPKPPAEDTGAAVKQAASQPPASNHIGDAKSSQDVVGLSAARTEVRGESLAGEGHRRGAAGAGDRASKEDSTISPADVNGHFDDAVPDWVQKEPVRGAPGQRQAGGQQAVGVVGEVGSITHGTGGFQTRRLFRILFGVAWLTPQRLSCLPP